ncbi:MAG TPA: lactate utilization protein [Erysipelotrichaceae bacterium]|nr:lactate utilization protein [Erysipelotrichaceae bacterium]
MDKNSVQIIERRLERAIINLRNHKFDVSVCDTKEDVNPLLEKLIEKGSTAAVGGSMTLNETNTLTWLRSGYLKFIDRYDPECDVTEVFHESFNVDAYITSSNAVTMTGELVNTDGNGNRVAAMIYGPKKVYVIVGLNKLVSNIDEGQRRIELYAAPMNCERLNRDTPCRKVGECVNCSVPERICSVNVVFNRSNTPNRIHIIFVKEDLGY